MIADKRKFAIGLVLLAGFVVVFVMLLMPIWGGGQNALDALDALYNSISKGSAYYIEDLAEKGRKHEGEAVAVRLEFKDDADAEHAAKLFEGFPSKGTTAERTDATLQLKGKFWQILSDCLEDADDLFENDADALERKYGYDGRQVLYTWWLVLGQMDKDLKRQEAFEQAKFVSTVKTKAVECAYNYYGIVPEKISNKIPIVLFSLVFYVVYTVWYGFAILYLFEGWGMRLAH
jgi:hypothetical protein